MGKREGQSEDQGTPNALLHAAVDASQHLCLIPGVLRGGRKTLAQHTIGTTSAGAATSPTHAAFQKHSLLKREARKLPLRAQALITNTHSHDAAAQLATLGAYPMLPLSVAVNFNPSNTAVTRSSQALGRQSWAVSSVVERLRADYAAALKTRAPRITLSVLPYLEAQGVIRIGRRSQGQRLRLLRWARNRSVVPYLFAGAAARRRAGRRFPGARAGVGRQRRKRRSVRYGAWQGVRLENLAMMGTAVTSRNAFWRVWADVRGPHKIDQCTPDGF